MLAEVLPTSCTAPWFTETVLLTVRLKAMMPTETAPEVEEDVVAAVAATTVLPLLMALLRNRCMVTFHHPLVLTNPEAEAVVEGVEAEDVEDLIVDVATEELAVTEARARCPVAPSWHGGTEGRSPVI